MLNTTIIIITTVGAQRASKFSRQQHHRGRLTTSVSIFALFVELYNGAYTETDNPTVGKLGQSRHETGATSEIAGSQTIVSKL